MKKIGILGGIGWRATRDYYQGLCLLAERRHQELGLSGTAPMPEIAIESLDLRTAIEMLGLESLESSWAPFDLYHRTALTRLARGGAEVGMIASATAHTRFDQIAQGVGMEFIDLFETAAREVYRLRSRRVLVLGTAATMRSIRLRKTLAKFGIEKIVPPNREAEETLFLIADLQQGNMKQATERLVEIILHSLGQARGKSAVLLGCTELPLALREDGSGPLVEVPIVDSAQAHIEAAFSRAIA